MNYLHRKRPFSSFQNIIMGFLLLLFAGCLLLMLPIATNDGTGASFLDALFTSTSAVCVTGLVVHDTVSYWSMFGQGIILILIQIGGVGVITVAVFIAIVSGRKIGLMHRNTMQEAIAAPNGGGIVPLAGFILKATAMIEIIGAAIMLPVFYKNYGMEKGIWYAVFHSVSAFCNAGFDLLGEKMPYSSLTFYASNPVILMTIMLLIVIGGIGFLTWDDMKLKKLNFKKYRMQSKVILTVTAILIVLSAFYFYFIEFSSTKWDAFSQKEKIWNSLFQAVTPRTAGFNTVELSAFSEAGQTIIMILMLIGGSPGSTAGGMKTTTIAVLFLTSFSVFRREEDAHCFGRRIGPDTIKYAAAILLMYLVLFLSGGIVISCMEGLPIFPCLFETASAIGTVGLSLGITAGLCAASKLILILLMFLGRVGGLTLIFAALSVTHANGAKFPQEKIIVG